MAKSGSAGHAAPKFDVHPSVRMVVKWVNELKSKTGRSLDEWMLHIRKSGPGSEAAVRDWLNSEYELGTNAAWWLAERAFAPPDAPNEDTPEGYLECAAKYFEALYAGSKAGLRPIHDELVRFGRSLGKDVKVCPCKTMVPLYRKHVFAQIKPSTRTRVDLGLCLTPLIKDGKKLPARLEDTGGYKKRDRITHRIALSSVEDIDDEARKWMKRAYELDA